MDGVRKRALDNPDKRRGAYSSWGLELSGVQDLLFLTGTTATAPDGTILFPGDAAGQARWILESQQRLLEAAGYEIAEVVRVETTVVERLTDEEIAAVGRVTAEFLGDLPVRPAAGTLRIVSRLIRPGVLVEIELVAAR